MSALTGQMANSTARPVVTPMAVRQNRISLVCVDHTSLTKGVPMAGNCLVTGEDELSTTAEAKATANAKVTATATATAKATAGGGV